MILTTESSLILQFSEYFYEVLIESLPDIGAVYSNALHHSEPFVIKQLNPFYGTSTVSSNSETVGLMHI